MASRKKQVTKDIQPVRELEVLTDETAILMLCMRMTHLKLDPACHMDRAYAKKWYEEHYINGVHARYIMKPGLTINHVGDGIVYRAFNCTDAIAVRLMGENKDYINYFEDLGEFVLPKEDEPTVIPEVEDEPTVIPEVEETPKEEAPADPAPEETPKDDEAALSDIEKELNEEK